MAPAIAPLRLLFWGALADLLLGEASWLAFRWARRAFDAGDHEAGMRVMEATGTARSVVDLAFLVATLGGAWGLGHAVSRARAASRVVVATTIVGLLAIVAHLVALETGRQSIAVYKALYWIGTLGGVGTSVALAVALQAAASTRGWRWPPWATKALVACALVPLALAAATQLLVKGDFVELHAALHALRSFVAIPALIAMGCAVRLEARSAIATAVSAATDPRASAADPDWIAAANGLRLHRGAILVQLVGGAIGVLLLISVFASSPGLDALGLILFLMLAIPGFDLLVGMFATAGLVGLARVPRESGGRGLAWMAAGLAAFGLVVGLYALVLLRLTTNHAFEVDSHGAEARLPYVQGAAIAAGVVGAVLATRAFRAVALHLGDRALGDRAGGLGAWIVATGTAALVLGWAVITDAIRTGQTIAVLAVALVAIALATAARYLGVALALARAIESRHEAHLPEARVHVAESR